MSRIGFRPTYLQDEEEAPAQAPPMQIHTVEEQAEGGTLSEAKRRLRKAQGFILTKAFTRLSDRAKATKLLDVEFLTLVVAELS
jgi:hypothetical protein